MMDDRSDPPGRTDLLRPEDVAKQLPSRPVLTSPAAERQGMVLQRYRELAIVRPNQVWCSDITYIPMRRGFL